MIIRDYRQGDFLQIEDLWKETGVYRSERGDSPEVILRCNAQGGRFLVLEDETNNKIIATSWLTWDGRRVHLQYLAVLPSRQGLGYGRKLAKESMAFIRNKGASVKLEVHRDNIPAIELYLSMGFKILEGYEVYLVYYEA
jgi:ribosomal protein S18 acetylase RimI-like enzyme